MEKTKNKIKEWKDSRIYSYQVGSVDPLSIIINFYIMLIGIDLICNLIESSRLAYLDLLVYWSVLYTYCSYMIAN